MSQFLQSLFSVNNPFWYSSRFLHKFKLLNRRFKWFNANSFAANSHLSFVKVIFSLDNSTSSNTHLMQSKELTSWYGEKSNVLGSKVWSRFKHSHISIFPNATHCQVNKSLRHFDFTQWFGPDFHCFWFSILKLGLILDWLWLSFQKKRIF